MLVPPLVYRRRILQYHQIQTAMDLKLCLPSTRRSDVVGFDCGLVGNIVLELYESGIGNGDRKGLSPIMGSCDSP